MADELDPTVLPPPVFVSSVPVTDALSLSEETNKQTTVSVAILKKPHQQITPPLTPPIGVDGNEFINFENINIDSHGRVDSSEQPLVAVMGCGYVGQHIIDSFSNHYNVLGFDVVPEQINMLRKKYEEKADRVNLTLDGQELTKATHFLISVPTLIKNDPFTGAKSIDTSYIRSALDTIAKYARTGSTIVVESSVAVGMTRELVGPLAKARGFFAGMSPERVDPGRTEPAYHEIPKVVSGLDDIVRGSTGAVKQLYEKVFKEIVMVTKPEVAEMMKLYENTQRMVIISHVNEMADVCAQFDVDPWEVSRVAATKPFGYLPVYPSAGVGGHCIPVNPEYLFCNCPEGFKTLRVATEGMAQRPVEIAQRALNGLFDTPKPTKLEKGRPFVQQLDSEIGLGVELEKAKADAAGRRSSTSSAASESGDSFDSRSTLSSRARVLVVGVGFKRGESVLSNSPGLKVAQTLVNSGQVDVMFADPLVQQEAIPQIRRLEDNAWNRETLETFDSIIVAVKQKGLDLPLLLDLQDVKVEFYADMSCEEIEKK